MKKSTIILVGVVLLLSSCNTYTGAGAYTGGMFGSILGSAIGGITGGPRGSDVGAIVGMAGGAAIGAVIGSAADEQEQKERETYYQRSYDRDRAELHEHYQKVMQNRETRGHVSGVTTTRKVSSDDLYRSSVSGRNDGNGNSAGSGNSGFDASNSGDDRLYDFDINQ